MKGNKIAIIPNDGNQAIEGGSGSSETETFSLFSDFDIELFKAGKHYHLYLKLGNHQVHFNGNKGVYFAVWAPNAKYVSIVGNFNNWQRYTHPMNARWDSTGIWELFIPNIQAGEVYKYFIESNNGYSVEKAIHMHRVGKRHPGQPL